MKKILYILLGICMLSCSTSNDDEVVVEEAPGVYPDKAYTIYLSGLFVSGPPTNSSHYQFTYTNGNLTGITNKFEPWPEYPDLQDYPNISLFYENNQIKVLTTSPGEYARFTIYTMDGKRPVKSEYYIMAINQKYYLNNTAYYTYEKNKITINREYRGTDKTRVSTYYFDDNHNLTKSEDISKSQYSGEFVQMYVYSDFDKAKNPFKSLWLFEGATYLKSLSTNNFRKVEYTSGYANTGDFEPTITQTYTYKYDADGQVQLYHPF